MTQAKSVDAQLAGRLTRLRLHLALVAKEQRESLNLTREAAATQAHVTPETVAQIETTAGTALPLETIYEYLHRIGVNLHLVASDEDGISLLLSDDENLPETLQQFSDKPQPESVDNGPDDSLLFARAVRMSTLYQLLISEVGAKPGQVADFLTHQLGDEPCPEYRFQGSLGFGGKLVYDRSRGFTVTCYPEDETPERKELLKKVNTLLHQHGFNIDPRYAPA